MTRQLTEKQEEFCQRFAEMGNATQAYIEAYDCDPNSKRITASIEASKMLKVEHIRKRVDELREEARERHHITIDTLIAELDEAYRLAKATKNSSAAIAATQAKAKLLGMSIDRQEVSGPGGSPIELQRTERVILDAKSLDLDSLEKLRLIAGKELEKEG